MGSTVMMVGDGDAAAGPAKPRDGRRAGCAARLGEACAYAYRENFVARISRRVGVKFVLITFIMCVASMRRTGRTVGSDRSHALTAALARAGTASIRARRARCWTSAACTSSRTAASSPRRRSGWWPGPTPRGAHRRAGTRVPYEGVRVVLPLTCAPAARRDAALTPTPRGRPRAARRAGTSNSRTRS